MKCLVFDLDDTLYSESDFLISGFRAVSKMLDEKNSHDLADDLLSRYQKKENAFEYASHKYNVSVQELLHVYRTHFPEISLYKDSKEILTRLKSTGHILGLITDGRSITQRNKIKALGIDTWFNKVVISEEFGSEKPDPRNYKVFQDEFKLSDDFCYFGDNTRKDFVAPLQLGWKCFCRVNNGKNIHEQDLDKLDSSVQVFSTFFEITKEIE